MATTYIFVVDGNKHRRKPVDMLYGEGAQDGGSLSSALMEIPKALRLDRPMSQHLQSQWGNHM